MNSRSLYFGMIASVVLVANAAAVRADGQGCAGPGCTGPGCAGKSGSCLPYPSYYNLGAFCGKGKPMPTYQAAPWYLYWPYDGHFLTPAPVTGAFFGPPTPGNFPVNPYFPGPSYGYGYAPVPGGAPPRQ